MGRALSRTAALGRVHFDWEQLTDSVHRCRLPFLDVTVGLVRGRTGALLVDREQDRAYRINAERALNDAHVAERNKPLPF